MSDNDKAILVHFPRPLTDDELRDLHELLAQRHWARHASELCREHFMHQISNRSDCLGHHHLRYMVGQIRDAGFSPTKACRWLGWVQAGMYLHGVPLASLKEVNLNASRQR